MLVYASLDDRTEVLQVVTDLRAGDVVTPESLRIVAVDVDATVPVVAADDLALVVGRHARVHIASGSLLSSVLLQPTPLLAPDSAVVAIEIRPTRVPDGLRERSLIELIVADELRTTARVVTRPRTVDGISGVVSMSVEVAVADAATVASGDDVRVIVLEPGLDPVYDGGD